MRVRKLNIDLKLIGIIALSYLTCTFPLAEYIQDPLVLQDVQQNIYNVSRSYFFLINKGYIDFFDYFKSQWLWAYCAVYFSELLESEELYFMIIGGINFFVYACFIYKNVRFNTIFLLLLPIQIVFLIYQPRLAFGCSLWILGILSSNVKRKYFLFLLSLLVHNAMFVIVGSYFVINMIATLKVAKFETQKKIALTILFSFLVNFIVGPLISVFTNLLDRGDSSRYEGDSLSASVVSSGFWGLIAVLFIIDILRTEKVNIYKLFAIFFTLFPVFSFLFSSGYPYRFLTVGMPFVVIGIFRTSRTRKKMLLLMYILFGLYTSLSFYKF